MRQFAKLASLVVAFGLFLYFPKPAVGAEDFVVHAACYVNLANGKQVALPNVTNQRSCTLAGKACIGGQAYNGIVWHSPGVANLLNASICDAGDGAGSPQAPPPPKISHSSNANPPPPKPSTELPANRGPIHRVLGTGKKNSGEGANFSEWYSICSDPLPPKYVITSHSFSLSGDRSCGAWSECSVSVDQPNQVCYRFRMQGHNDTPAVFRDNGARESQGTLTYDSVYAGPPEPPPKPADPYPSASNIRIVNDCSETVHINIRWQQPGIEPWQNSAWNISSGESTYLNATNIGRVKTNIIPVYYYAFSYPNLEWKEPIDTARHKITVTRNDSKMERGMKRFDAPKDNSDATIRLTCGK